MEHRWSRRNPVSMEGLVFHRIAGLLRVNIRNISPEGAFIASEHPTLPSQAIVELSIALPLDGKWIIQQIDALVIHRACNGYGLMFKDLRLAAFQAPLKFLQPAWQ